MITICLGHSWNGWLLTGLQAQEEFCFQAWMSKSCLVQQVCTHKACKLHGTWVQGHRGGARGTITSFPMLLKSTGLRQGNQQSNRRLTSHPTEINHPRSPVTPGSNEDSLHVPELIGQQGVSVRIKEGGSGGWK